MTRLMIVFIKKCFSYLCFQFETNILFQCTFYRLYVHIKSDLQVLSQITALKLLILSLNKVFIQY